MLKKFVKLNASGSPSSNPHEVRTFKGNSTHGPEWCTNTCVRPDRICKNNPVTSSITKVLTNDAELKILHKTSDTKSHYLLRRKCVLGDNFQQCVVPQRSPQDLKSHSVCRERYLRVKHELLIRKHDAIQIQSDPCPSLVRLNSPMQIDAEEEEAEEEDTDCKQYEKRVKLRYATPSCSLDTIYIPPQKLLELKRPKSGLFHNESKPPCVPFDGFAYSKYNPRLLQKKFDDQGLRRIDVVDGESPIEMWTWNLGLQKSDASMEREYLDAHVSSFDCQNPELSVFKIPRDINATYRNSVVYGTTAIPKTPEPRKKDSITYFHRPREVACLFVAFVQTFRLSPDFWTGNTLDNILKMGDKLLDRSVKLNYKADDGSGFDIIKILLEYKAVIDVKPHFSGNLYTEPNIYKSLTLYFSKFSAGLLIAQDLYLLIWKACSNIFYVFDPNGRNQLCKRDYRHGMCSLMCLPYVEHLVHLIVNTSKVKPNIQYSLYGICLVDFGRLKHILPKIPYPKRFRKLWAVVNNNFVIIPSSNIGIHQPLNGKSKNSSMSIALFALFYACIEGAQYWTPGVLDDLHRYGTKYHRSTVKHRDLLKHIRRKKRTDNLDIHDLPDTIMMGAMKVKFQTHPFLGTGHVNPCKDYYGSQLTSALREIFCNGWDTSLLQIDNSVLAIWRDNKLFYMFDPFRRDKAGQVLDPEDFKTKGASCLQMHTTFDSLCRILYMKALKLRRGGKFFLHGIRIICIKPMIKLWYVKSFYRSLKIGYPMVHEDYIEEEEEIEEEMLLKMKPATKKRRWRRVLSIHSIPVKARIPSYSSHDVVVAVLEDILCEILKKLPEAARKPQNEYRQAEKVLLRSDKDYLEALKYKLKHGEDVDNIFQANKSEPAAKSPSISLEEELLLSSNFSNLPDGSWVIFGKIDLPLVDEGVLKLSALLSCLTALCLSAKYKISTWGPEIIDFAIESVNQFGEQFKTCESALSAIFSNKLPDISIGDNCYCIGVEKVIRSGVMHSLRQVLLECLLHSNKLLVVCAHFSCIIIRRYNFLYMFVAYACNQVGYRHFGAGPACLLRFVELDALLRRIEFGCNPKGCDISNYIVIPVRIGDITYGGTESFRKWRNKEQDDLFDDVNKEHQRILLNRKEKMRFLEEELKMEINRINNFNVDKKNRRANHPTDQIIHCPKRADRKTDPESHVVHDADYESEMGEREEEEEIYYELKHKPGTILAKELIENIQPEQFIYGYQRRLRDGLFKIQGSKALEGRNIVSSDEIKLCYFVSSIALLYAVLKPLDQWSSQRVDRVIDEGKLVASRVSTFKSASSRLIENINVDDYIFNIRIQAIEELGLKRLSARQKIVKITKERHYLMIQAATYTFAIYHDEFYHLFDPYRSMELINFSGAEEEEEQERLGLGYEEVERNTASWVLFANIDCMLEYIDKRVTTKDWQHRNAYKFYIINIVAHKKAPPKLRILQLLTKSTKPTECKASWYSKNDSAVCAHNETIAWLEDENTLPIWSRLNRRNAAGKYRNLMVTKLKKYDIEIEGCLWSLWGNLHPMAPCFEDKSRGKQFLACNVVACCAAHIYRLDNWSQQLLDNIVISGDKYHRESLAHMRKIDYEFSLEDLNLNCELENIKFAVHMEHVAYGCLYCIPNATKMNLAEGLMYFFSHFQFGILQVRSRSLAFGRTLGFGGGYFLFDCQSQDHPLFPRGQGAAYLLRTYHLQILLYCIVMALRIPYYNVQYTLHKVEVLRDGALLESEFLKEDDS